MTLHEIILRSIYKKLYKCLKANEFLSNFIFLVLFGRIIYNDVFWTTFIPFIAKWFFTELRERPHTKDPFCYPQYHTCRVRNPISGFYTKIRLFFGGIPTFRYSDFFTCSNNHIYGGRRETLYYSFTQMVLMMGFTEWSCTYGLRTWTPSERELIN